jgi:predicted amidohydrolase YtcJ
LAAYTTDGAYAEYAEDKKGKLKPGMFADVIMLSGYLEATPPHEIDQMSVALTICDGVITYLA